jgi:hypothetical protein
MQQLRKVLTQTTWANASDAINKNSDRIYEAITRVENATTKNKGYFETSNALLDTYPNPSVGDIAFVFNSANNIDTPYDVYKTAFSSTTNTYEWYDSGINAPFADVDINSVNDSIRDIEQQVDTLKDPRLPIICDANGRLGLNVGNGLYVDSNGDLCATQSIGGGGGSGSGGETYYAAAGISINEDNFISVKIGASLEFDNNNALKVGTGEGLVHNSNGKLSVNVGKGLVIDNKTNAIELEDYDAIKEIPIAIQKKQDKLIEGSGIEITSENVINVDGSTMHVQLSTNAINDEDGKRIKTTYAKKEEVDGIYGAIEATNTTVASHTTRIENLTNNKQDKLEFGNGLSTVGNLVKVEDAVLKDIADNKKNIGTLSSSISGKQDKLTASDGINLNEGKVSVRIGTGLDFDPLSSAVVVKVGAGVETDINQALAIKHDATLTTDADGQLGVNQGIITNIAASEVAKVVANAPANYDTLKEIADYIATDAEGAAQLSNRIGAVESALPNKQDTISDLATIRNNAANGATAYGWGYHGTAGYAKKAKVNGSTYEADSNGVINLPSYPTSLPANGGNADTVGGLYASIGDNKPWGTIPAITPSGHMDIGRHLEFHYDNETGSDYSAILMCQGNYSNIVYLPTRDGTLALTNGIADAGVYDSGNFNNFLDKSFIGSIFPSDGGAPGNLHWYNTIQIAHRNGMDDGAGYVSQIAIGMTGDENKMWFRGLRWMDWIEVISSANFHSRFSTGFESQNDGTIAISTSYIASALKGDGLIVNDKGLSVDSGVCLNQITKNIAFPFDTDLIKDGFLDSNYGYQTDWFFKAICKWAIKKYKGSGNILLIGVASPNVSGTCILSLYSNYEPNNDGYPKYCSGQFEDLGGNIVTFGFYDYNWLYGSLAKSSDIPTSLPANGGNADTLDGHDSSYFATASSLDSKQDKLTFGDSFESKNDGTIAISTSYIAANIKGDGLVVNDSGLSVESAPKLSTPRTIWGKSFDGSGDVDGNILFSNYSALQSYKTDGTKVSLLHINDSNVVTLGNDGIKTNISGTNVGIGTTDPQYKLDVNGCINAMEGVRVGGCGNQVCGLYCNSQITGGGSPNTLWIYNQGDLHVYSTKTIFNNNVGIGTTGSQYNLDVNGTIGATTYLFKNNPNIYLDSTTENALIFYDGVGRRNILHSGNLLTYFTNGFEHVDGALRVSTSYIGENMKGDGLALGENGRLSVNVGEGFQISDNVVQLKLSTGLAIDDRGYLYVTGL